MSLFFINIDDFAHSLCFWAGIIPIYSPGSLIFLVMSVWAPTFTSLQISRCPKTPDRPPIWKFSPIREDPAIAQHAAMAEFFWITTLCAICTWLSKITPSCISVSSRVPLSIVQFDPIWTLLPIISLPSCSIFSYPLFDDANPKPSDPNTEPQSIYAFDPIDTFSTIETFALMTTSEPILQLGPIKTLGPI